MLGIDCTNGKHLWPGNVPSIGIGRDAYLDGTDNLCRKLLGTLAVCNTYQELQDFTHFCIIEQDAIFLRTPPLHPGKGLFVHPPGFCPPEWKKNSPWFFHTPWWVDRESAGKIVSVGYDLLKRGIDDGGTPDCFIGSCIKEAGIDYIPMEGTFSVNSGSLSEEPHMHALRASIKEKIGKLWYIHGIKSEEELSFINSCM